MMSKMRVDYPERKIILARSFAKSAEKVGSPEYVELQDCREKHPDFKVVKREYQKNYQQEHYAGMTYEYMVDYIIIVIHSQREEAQVQVRGRYREDLDTLYLLKYEAIIDVPPEFLGKKLFSDRKEALCGALKLRNKQGRIVGWPSVKKALKENGYSVKEGRCQNERYPP